MLEVRDIRKSFNGFTAVGGVSLDVPAESITAVIGPNGAGKSTFFNLLTGHLRADAGRVAYGGRDITGAAPHAICPCCSRARCTRSPPERRPPSGRRQRSARSPSSMSVR